MDVNKVYALLMIEEKTRLHPSLKDLHNAAMDELMQLNAEEAGPTVVKAEWPAPKDLRRGQPISEPKQFMEPKSPPLSGGQSQDWEPEHAS